MKSYVIEYIDKNGMSIQSISHEYKMPERKIGDIHTVNIVAKDDNDEIIVKDIEFEVIEVRQYTKEIDEQIHIVVKY